MRRDAIGAMLDNPACEIVPLVPNPADTADRIELVHHQYGTFTTWPYLHYFIPMIPSNWQGTGYFPGSCSGR